METEAWAIWASPHCDFDEDSLFAEEVAAALLDLLKILRPSYLHPVSPGSSVTGGCATHGCNVLTVVSSKPVAITEIDLGICRTSS